MHPRRAFLDKATVLIQNAFDGKIPVLEEPGQVLAGPGVALVAVRESAREFNRTHNRTQATEVMRIFSFRIVVSATTPVERDSMAEKIERAIVEGLKDDSQLPVRIEDAEFQRTAVGANVPVILIAMMCEIQYLAKKGLPL